MLMIRVFITLVQIIICQYAKYTCVLLCGYICVLSNGRNLKYENVIITIQH